MPFKTLIAPEHLAAHLGASDWVIVDCRFSLADTAAGRRAYRQSHIPGAVYAHLDEDLSGPPATDDGRHPLPTPDALVALFRRLGINDTSQVVVYDDSGGAIAARLWWMLGYMGHEATAVLDGGWSAWLAAALPTTGGEETNAPGTVDGRPQPDRLVLLEEVTAVARLIDSRDAPRYRGEEELIDPVAGHIPGAVNYPYKRNLGNDGRFLPPDQLRRQLSIAMGGTAPEETTFYCGSGVTACHNLLALRQAGLGDGRLYVGSWSEWSRDPTRPLERSTDSAE